MAQGGSLTRDDIIGKGQIVISASMDPAAKRSITDFLGSINQIIRGDKLGQYFDNLENVSSRFVASLQRFKKEANNINARSLVNDFNALQGIADANGKDFTSLFKNIAGGYDAVKKSILDAQSVAGGTSFDGITAKAVKDFVTSSKIIEQWGVDVNNVVSAVSANTSTDELRIRIKELNDALAVANVEKNAAVAANERYRKSAEDAAAATERLKQQYNDKFYGADYQDMIAKAEAYNEVIRANVAEVQRFIEISKLGTFDKYGDMESSVDYDNIDAILSRVSTGASSASEAIIQLKTQYGSLIDLSDTKSLGEDKLLSLEQTVRETAAIVNELKSSIGTGGFGGTGGQTILDKAIGSSEEINSDTESARAAKEVIVELLNSLANAGSSAGAGETTIAGLVSSLRDLASINVEGLTATSDIIRNLANVNNIRIDEKQINNLINSLKKLYQLSRDIDLTALTTLTNINLSGFSNLTIRKEGLSHLATYLPVISNANVSKLRELSQVNLSNFNYQNMKISEASFKHLKEIIEMMSGKPVQIISNKGTTVQQLNEQKEAVSNLISIYEAHDEAIARAVEEEQNKAVVSETLTGKLRLEKEAVDAVSSSSNKASVSGNKLTKIWDQMFLGKFSAQLVQMEEKFAALNDKPAKLAENMKLLRNAESDMQKASTTEDKILAFERFSTILDVVRSQLGAESAAERNAATSARDLLRAMNEAQKASLSIKNDAFINTLKKYEALAKGINNNSLITNLKTMRQAFSDMNNAYGKNGPQNEADLYKISEAYDRWKNALAGVKSALSLVKAENSEVAKQEASMRSLVSGADNATQKIAALQDTLSKLKTPKQIDTSSLQEMERLISVVRDTTADTATRQGALTQLQALLDATTQSVKALTDAESENVRQRKTQESNESKRISMLSTLQAMLNKAEAAEKKFAHAQNSTGLKQTYTDLKTTTNAIRDMANKLQNGATPTQQMANRIKELRTELSRVKTEFESSGNFLSQWWTNGLNMLTSRVSYTFGLVNILMKTTQEIKKMVSTAVELDSAMNTLQIVTRNSGTEMDAYGRKVSSMAKETAQSTKDLIDATTVYARLGYSMDESAVLAKYTAMLQGVGDIDASAAQDAMTAIIKAFGKNVSDVEDVMNKLVVVGNNFPISVSQLAEGMNNAGSMLAVAGNSMEESVALLTAANTTTQDISKSSTGLRTIAARIRKTKTELDELGEAINESKYEEMIQALAGHGVRLTENGEYRSTYAVLKDIAHVWKDLSSMDQAAVIESLAGTRQQNVFSSLITQFREAEEAMSAMEDSAGALESAYSIRLESINAHVQQMKAAFDKLSVDFVDSDFAKAAVDLLTKIIELLDFIIERAGVLTTVIGAGAFPGLFKMLSSGTLVKNVTQLASAMGLLSKSTQALTTVSASAMSLSAAAPIITAVAFALSLLHHNLKQIQDANDRKISDAYDKSMANAKEASSIYELYAAYEDAKLAQDGTEESKKTLQIASENLANALGIEKGAVDALKDSFASLTVEQLKKASQDAVLAVGNASKALLNLYNDPANNSTLETIFGNNNAHELAFVEKFARDNGFETTDISDPFSKVSEEDKAKTIAAIYDKMQERQQELYELMNTDGYEPSKKLTKEYDQLGDALTWLKPQVDNLNSAIDTYNTLSVQAKDITRGTTDPVKKLSEALNSISDNAVKALLTGSASDSDIEELRTMVNEFYENPDALKEAVLNNSDVVIARISAPLEEAKSRLSQLQKEVTQQGVDISKTVFGNIDTNNRQILSWTEDKLAEFKTELESWGQDPSMLAGTVSTVLGGSENFNGVEIAFSPILQTDDGPKLLSRDTVIDYVSSLIDELNESGNEWDSEDLFKLDARGIEKDGKKISGLLADIGDTAKDTGKNMRYLGEDGELSRAAEDVAKAQEYLNSMTTDISTDGIDSSVEKSVSELATLRDELSKTNAALADYKEAMEGGEKDAAVKEAAEIYKGALEDIQAGRIDSKRMHAAAELFFPKDWLQSVNWDMKSVAAELQNSMWQYLFDPEEQSDIDFGQRFAEYVKNNFTVDDGVWVEGNTFLYDSLQDVAKAFNMSEEAAAMFLSALDMYGTNTMRSTEENMKLADSYLSMVDDLKDAEAAVQELAKLMHGDNMDAVEIHAVMSDLQQAGVIDVDADTMHAAIDEALGLLKDVDETQTEPVIGLDYDAVVVGVANVTALLDGLCNGVHIVHVAYEEDNSLDMGQGSAGGNTPAYSSYPQIDAFTRASGKTSGQPGGLTLVNELGPELISDRGKAFFANGGKPGFVDLTKDAIVFNADQTEEILRQNKKAVGHRAFATGSDGTRLGIRSRLLSGKRYGALGYAVSRSVQKCPRCGSNVDYGTSVCPYCGYNFAGGGFSTAGTTTLYKDDDGGWSSSTRYNSYGDYDPGYYYESYDTSYEDALAARNEYLEEQAALQRERIKKIKEQRKILAAQEYNNTPKKSGLAGTGGGNNVGGADYASESNPDKVDWVAVRINRVERAIADLEKVATSGFKKLDTRLGAAKKQIASVTEEIDVMNRAYTRYLSEARGVGLDSELEKKVEDGTIDINEYDEDTRKKIDEYTEWYEKALDAKSAVEELHQDIAQLYVDMFDNIQADYENQLAQIEHSSNMVQKNMEMATTKGYLESAIFYQQLADTETQNIAKLKAELLSLNVSFKEAMDSGEIEEGSEAWYEMKNSINEVEEAIADANIQLVEYQRTIRSLDWSYFDYAQEKFSKLTDEANFLIGVMSNDKLFQDNGQFNDFGEATAGMHAVNYDVYMAQADEYAKEIQKIQRDLEKDPYDTELIERREALLSLQRQSIQSAEAEKDAVKNLVQEGINLELQALKELIDTYNESLDSAKDLYEYQKKVTEKTADIASIQKQLTAYAGDTSEETRAKVQKLNTDLETAQTELKDMEWEQSISDQKKLLDDLYEEYEDFLNARLDDVDLLMQDIIAGANENRAEINSTLHEVGNEVGYTVTDQMNTAMQGDLEYYDKMFNGITSVHVVLTDIYSMVAAMAQASGAVKAYATGGLVDYTGLAAVHGTKGKPELMLNANDTQNFLEAAKMMRDLLTGTSLSSVPQTFGTSSGVAIGQLQVNIPIEHVLDYNELVSQMQNDPKFERLINAMTLDRAVGRSSFGKNKIFFG